MSRNGSGTYQAPSGSFNPATNGNSATAADWNTLLADLVAAMTQSVSADGQTPITGNFNMGNNKLTALAAGIASGESLAWQQLFSQGAESDVPSAATIDIGLQNTNFLRITGTTTIASFGTNLNGPRFLRFAGILTLTHNATTLILPGAANIITAAGDSCIATPIAGGWQVVAYQRASGLAINTPFLQNYLRITADITASGATLTIPATQAASSDNAAMMTIATTFTKTTSIFVAGTGNGGLDTGAMAAFTEYFLYQVRNPSTGVVDYTFSTNSSAPAQTGNLAGFTQSRRLPIILRTGATASQFVFCVNQAGNGREDILYKLTVTNVTAINLYVPTSYGELTLDATDLRVTVANQQIGMQLLNNATTLAGVADYTKHFVAGDGGAVSSASSTDNFMTLLSGTSTNATFVQKVRASISNIHQTSRAIEMISQTGAFAGSGNASTTIWTNWWTGATSGVTTARNGLQINSAQNFSGTFILRGIPL